MGISLNPATLLNGNGLDVSSLVSQILAQESGQLTAWQQQQSSLQTQATDLGTLNTDLSNLATAVNALTDPNGALNAVSANSSMPAILTATAQNSATPGTYNIVVSSLASAGTVYTAPVAGGANASFLPSGATGGDIQLQVGGTGGTVYDIPITQGSNDTLTTLASYINQQSSQNNWGVTATVLTDSSGARLAIYSQATGAPGALAITTNTTTGTLYTADLASPDTTILPNGEGSGDIQLQIGGTNGTIEDIPIIAGSNDTLNTLASYINQQSSQNNWGVTASVVQDSGGYHLAIYSQATGPAGALAFTNNTTILTTVPNPPTNLTFETPVGGTDAALTINGIPYYSDSNTVTGAISGVTLNLVSAEPDVPLQLTVGPDTTQATDAINTFVTAYNALMTAINQEFTVNSTSNTEGPLGSDSSVRSLQSSLLTDATYAVSGNSGGLVNLASLGINMNDDGTLTVDSATLGNLLSTNASAVVDFFQNSSQTGFGNNFGADLTNLTDPTYGVLNADLAENQTQQQDLATEISNFQDQLSTQQQQLTQEFDQVNSTLQAYPALLNEVTSLLSVLLPNSSNSSNSSNTSGG